MPNVPLVAHIRLNRPMCVVIFGYCGLPFIYARPQSGINFLRNLRIQFFRYIEFLPVGEYITSIFEIFQ